MAERAEQQTGALFTRIDHVGIAVAELDPAVDFYVSTFGLTLAARETNDEQGVVEAMLAVAGSGSYVQLLQPLHADTPVGRFLARHGPGVHHVGYGVDDVQSALAELAELGIRLVDSRPRHGSLGASIAFLHPKSVTGVLTELVQAAQR